MYDKFAKLLENKGVSAYKVAKEIGITQQAFSGWKQGKYELKQDKLQKIADYFNVPLSYFYGAEIINPFLTPRKKGCVFQHPSVRGIRYASREDF